MTATDTAAPKTDGIDWTAHAVAHKFTDDDVARVAHLLDKRPEDVTGEDMMAHGGDHETAEAHQNGLTTAGLTRLWALANKQSVDGFTATTLRIGVGDGAGGFAIGDTDLGAGAGATHRQFSVMDSTYPQFAAGVMTAQASWAAGVGNFAWNEWGLDIGAATVTAGTTVNACLVNHKTSAGLGTKATGIWVLQITITIA